jgi:hypothetical protein
MTAKKYFDGFGDYQSMLREFQKSTYDYEKREYNYTNLPGDVPTEDEVVFAAYGLEEAYSGSAIVIFEKNGELFENQGGHCSCNGLEDQWQPGKVTWEALALRLPKDGRQDDYFRSPLSSAYTQEANDAFAALIKSKVRDEASGQADLDRYNA